MDTHVARQWTVTALATSSALSRSAFFEHFIRTVGRTPMEYLLAWRMAVAKDLLHRTDISIGEVAERVGHGSGSTFSTHSAGMSGSRRVGTAARISNRETIAP